MIWFLSIWFGCGLISFIIILFNVLWLDKSDYTVSDFISSIIWAILGIIGLLIIIYYFISDWFTLNEDKVIFKSHKK